MSSNIYEERKREKTWEKRNLEMNKIKIKNNKSTIEFVIHRTTRLFFFSFFFIFLFFPYCLLYRHLILLKTLAIHTYKDIHIPNNHMDTNDQRYQ